MVNSKTTFVTVNHDKQIGEIMMEENSKTTFVTVNQVCRQKIYSSSLIQKQPLLLLISQRDLGEQDATEFKNNLCYC